MKYLVIFEAFESDILSKVIKFIDKNVTDKSSKDYFINRLKNLMKKYNIPIDKIRDENIQYLNKNKALRIKNENEIDNEYGIYCLKFWFSIDKGLLGFTGVGNLRMNFEKFLANRAKKINRPFSEEELEYIKNVLGITTGTLKPISNLDDLEHGQEIIGIFSSDLSDYDRIGLAKIWKTPSRIFAIQNVAEGGEPDRDVDGESWTSWRYVKDGRRYLAYSWSLGFLNDPGDDFGKLHIYIPSDEPLTQIGVDEKTKESNLDFNLPINSSFEIDKWDRTNYSIDDWTIIEQADFAIIVMIDDIIKSRFEPVETTKKKREESKKGSIKLISDEEIKNINLERYFKALIGKLGISNEITKLKNLQNLLIKSTCGDYAFFSIYKSKPSFSNLERLIDNIRNILNSDQKDFYYKKSLDSYKNIQESNLTWGRIYNDSVLEISKSSNEDLKELFSIFISIGKKIKKYLLTQNIETLGDLTKVLVKLRSIKMLLAEQDFNFSGDSAEILSEFHYPEDVSQYSRNFNFKEIKEDIQKAKEIEKYVDSLLR